MATQITAIIYQKDRIEQSLLAQDPNFSLISA
jgi:hypothetical protein